MPSTAQLFWLPGLIWVSRSKQCSGPWPSGWATWVLGASWFWSEIFQRRKAGVEAEKNGPFLWHNKYQRIRSVSRLSQVISRCHLPHTTHLAFVTSPSQPEILSGAKLIPLALLVPLGCWFLQWGSKAPFWRVLPISHAEKRVRAGTWPSFAENSYPDLYLFTSYKFKPLECLFSFLFWIFAPKYFAVAQKGFLKELT